MSTLDKPMHLLKKDSNMTDNYISQTPLMTWKTGLLLSLCLLAWGGCGSPDNPTDNATVEGVPNEVAGKKNSSPVQVTESGTKSKSTATDAQPAKSRGLIAKIKFKTSNGDTAFSIKPQDNGAKLVYANEKEIARFVLDGSKMKVKNADDKVLGYIVAYDDGYYKIKNADQSVDLYKFQPQSDGDWKLEDAVDKLIYKIKKRSYGFEIEDDAEKSLFKAKLKEGKSSLRNAEDVTVYSTKDQIPILAIVCLGFETLDDTDHRLELQAALMTMLIIAGQ
ncbi:MAG: hypothetical protein COA78_28695 [Blastopirellula sp.]|nr:MAG: hypothetical protein COA78_28695 [Blastopirellula sp.]